jgi:hypothetical protein
VEAEVIGAERPQDASILATAAAAYGLPLALRWPCASSSAAFLSDRLRPLTG